MGDGHVKDKSRVPRPLHQERCVLVTIAAARRHVSWAISVWGHPWESLLHGRDSTITGIADTGEQYTMSTGNIQCRVAPDLTMQHHIPATRMEPADSSRLFRWPRDSRLGRTWAVPGMVLTSVVKATFLVSSHHRVRRIGMSPGDSLRRSVTRTRRKFLIPLIFQGLPMYEASSSFEASGTKKVYAFSGTALTTGDAEL